MKKIIRTLTFILLAFTTLSTAVFADNDLTGETVRGYKFDGDIDKYLEEQIELSVWNEMQKTNDIRSARMSEWYVEYSSPVYVHATGYAGNQPAKGKSFGDSGGSFFYSASGGPSVSVTATIGGAWGNISFSIPIGQCADNTSYIINVPGRGYYKLWVDKTICVKPYTLYTKQSGTNTWTPTYLSQQETYTIDFRVDKVG